MIGMFDSGLGGLTVLKEILQEQPNLDIVYLGDTARVPWGNKKSGVVKHYSRQLTHFLINQNIDLLVVACHTASSVALAEIEKESPIPVVSMISPSVEDTIRLGGSNIGIVGTRTTIQSGSWQRELKSKNPHINIISQACPMFVPIVEEGLESHPITNLMIEHYLGHYRNSIDSLILACTHYPLLEPQLRSFFPPHIQIINPGKSVAQYLKNISANPGKGDVKLYFTDLPSYGDKFLATIKPLGNVKIESVSLDEIEHE